MKKSTLLHSSISALIAQMGHGDTLTIADAGLPIPADVMRIDLALRRDLPRFVDVLTTILSELKVAQVTLAEEIKRSNPELLIQIEAMMSCNGIERITFVAHEKFKILTRKSRAVVRSGECHPFANILLHCGVVF